jgi:Protein kinase domain
VFPSDGVPPAGDSAPSAAEGERPAPLAAISGYEVLDELGHGGMGIVYKARDLSLGRIVAIKMIAEAAYAQPAQLRRFLAEAEAVARLKHPNIIAIHQVGQEAGRPYLSLEFAEGGNLAQRLAQGPLSSPQAAELVEALARAVGAAHKAGVIHRDLKPSNVLMTADGIPKIGDFGLAKLLGDESARTLSGEVLGTPSYMAPEQAEGRTREVGPAADIYALGAILYQALTVRPPFLGLSAVETLKLVVTAEVVPPRRLRPDVARDLETICLKCLEKEPARRYADAAALAQDLRRFLEGRPIAARPIAAIGRLRRWGRRNPTLAGTATALVLAFALGTPALFGLWLRARAEQTRAEVERDRAERSRDRAVSAVRMLLQTDDEAMLSEELWPYRKALIDAGLRESQALVEDLEGDPRAEFQRVHAYGALARIQQDGGDKPGAIATINKAIALAEDLTRRNPADLKFRRALASSLHRAATFHAADAEGLALARRSNEILRTIPEEARDTAGDALVMSAINHFNTGHMYITKGQVSLALAEFLAARAAYDGIIARGDRSLNVLDFAARNLMYLGRIFGTARLEESLAAGRQAESIYQGLVREHPDSFDSDWQLSIAQEELGNRLLDGKREPKAIEWFEASRRTLEDMAARHGGLVSRMARIQERTAQADFNLMEAYESDMVRYARARRDLAAEAYEICEKLSLFHPLPWNDRIVHAHTAFVLADSQAEDGLRPDLELLLKAERLWGGMFHQSPTFDMAQAGLVVVRRRLAAELVARGQTDEAARWDRCALDPARGHPEVFYEVALKYARSAGLVGRYPTRLDARQRDDRRRQFAADAVAMLRQAEAEGFRDATRLRQESQFDPIRADAAFRAILDGLEFPVDPFAPP